jgi:phosphate ABC transporter phosphate-binding protein
MTARRFLWIAISLCWLMPLGLYGGTRLFVETLAARDRGDRLRDALVAELRRSSAISVVTRAADAEAILGGGGEIWVQGYRSLNPRSGTQPDRGKPVYKGYLSVELKDPAGETLWSYLVTPGADGGDIAKDLARRIAKAVEEVIQQPRTLAPRNPLPAPSIVLKGAGATFPYPVYQKWFLNFRQQNPKTEIEYEAVGSQEGMKRLLASQVDFGASDDPAALHELAPESEGRYLFFPSVVGAVVPIVNLPGFGGDIVFTAEALAGIYLGKIRKWNDPILARANKGLHLPDLDIVVVHRSDGSGTSYAWTDYLSKVSPEWKAAVGSGLTTKWPVGRGAAGNDGVAKYVKEVGGSIGYVEYIYALQNHLSYGAVRNRNGEAVAASLESLAAALKEPVEMGEELKVSIVNAPGRGAYPIASFTWLVVPAHIESGAKKDAFSGFLRWMLGTGQNQAAALGYLPLPKDLVRRELEAIARIR